MVARGPLLRLQQLLLLSCCSPWLLLLLLIYSCIGVVDGFDYEGLRPFGRRTVVDPNAPPRDLDLSTRTKGPLRLQGNRPTAHPQAPNLTHNRSMLCFQSTKPHDPPLRAILYTYLFWSMAPSLPEREAHSLGSRLVPPVGVVVMVRTV